MGGRAGAALPGGLGVLARALAPGKRPPALVARPMAAKPSAHGAATLPLRRWPHHTAGEVAMPVVQRHAVATVDSATDKATVLVGESRGIAMRAGSARKATVLVVEIPRVLLGMRGGNGHGHSRSQCQVQHSFPSFIGRTALRPARRWPCACRGRRAGCWRVLPKGRVLRKSRLCRRGSLNARFAPKATELLRHRDLSPVGNSLSQIGPPSL